MEMTKLPVRVLVVDDEELTRQVSERALRKGGYDVISASNGHQALMRLEQSPSPFDLYVLDVMMPAMQGPELAQRIRQRHPDAKVLYLTGYSDSLFPAGRSVLPGNEAFLDKPASIKALLESASLLLFGHTRGLDGANPH
jgi:two-component system cell cycle sensor histidine kinase/response regulator CckA